MTLWQYRIIIVVRLRSQIFRRIVQDGEKDASKRRVSRRRRLEKALAVNCVVLPQLTEWSDIRDMLSIISDRFRHV